VCVWVCVHVLWGPTLSIFSTLQPLRYHLNLTNSIITIPQTLSSECHELCHLNVTNSTIQISRILSSKLQKLYPSSRRYHLDFHKYYDRNITNSVIYVSRTLSSQYHELFNLNLRNSIFHFDAIIYRFSRIPSSTHHTNSIMHVHELYHLCITISTIYIS